MKAKTILVILISAILAAFALMIWAIPSRVMIFTIEQAEASEGQIEGIITAYTSRPEETDDTPDITASGERTRHGVIANNCLEFGSRVYVEGIEYEVLDRMNSRYGCGHFDIWFADYEAAIAWGKRILPVEVIP